MGMIDRNTDIRKRLVKARAAMVMSQPFFASLALRLELKEDPDCATAWTDGKVFAYNPDYIRILPDDKLVGLSAHTVMHPACQHHKRRKGRDPSLWNKACDYAINPIVIEAGLALPDGFLYEKKFEGWSADAVYDLLQDSDADPEKGEGGQQESDPADEKSTDSSGEADAELAVISDHPPESDMSDPGMAGEVRDGISEPTWGAGEEQAETDWEEALVQAAANARTMGKLPRGLELFVQETLRPQLPWQTLLSMFIQQSARTDYSWIQPNRRYLHQDLYLPSLVSDQLPELAVAVDTSGSIQPRELDQFAGELSAILGLTPSRTHLIYSDLAVTGYQVADPWDLPLSFTPRGGGGTDFRPVFDFIDQKAIQPYCLIFMSDLACRLFPPKAPDYPVLWVKTGGGGFSPPFGQMIAMGH